MHLANPLPRRYNLRKSERKGRHGNGTYPKLARSTAENLRGIRGEAIFVARISNFCDRDLPYFDPHFLGDKFPVFDHLVNVVDGTEVSAFFFAQVRTTGTGYETRQDGKKYLKVQASREDLEAMRRYPGPAYFFGIDDGDDKGRAYVVAISGERRSGFSAMTTDFEVDCHTLRTMWDEVKAYWAGGSSLFTSRFALK